ncbi:uncharacterized protein BcabD6B2_18620 [Babesia caballi]|uniref:Uncharacterized protein n=1 Tax=Babesia caballi TaxID=5871 RepID=A0AAV4LS07_BABCB|nr:hypothetical protein, conserved [Babesia caballi]
MLDVCQGANQKLLELTTPLLSLFAPLSLMVRGKRDAAPVCKTIDAMDEAGHRSGVGAGQRRKDTDTASTTPESNSVNADCGSTDAWSHSARVTDLKDVKGAKRAPWDTPAWTATLSDMTTNSGTQCSSDDVGTEASQMAPDGKYHKSESDDRGAELPGILGASKYKRSNSFAGAASYGGATQAATTAENSWEADSSYHGAASDGGDVLRRFMADLRRKRMANAKYPSDTASYTNNRFAYVRGPLGFPTVFRDTETREVVRSECSTLPLTVFSEFTPSHLEDNAVAVQPSDKVDIIARHNRWLGGVRGGGGSVRRRVAGLPVVQRQGGSLGRRSRGPTDVAAVRVGRRPSRGRLLREDAAGGQAAGALRRLRPQPDQAAVRLAADAELAGAGPPRAPDGPGQRLGRRRSGTLRHALRAEARELHGGLVRLPREQLHAVLGLVQLLPDRAPALGQRHAAGGGGAGGRRDGLVGLRVVLKGGARLWRGVPRRSPDIELLVAVLGRGVGLVDQVHIVV